MTKKGPARNVPFVLTTIGDITQTLYEMWAWCPECMRGRELDLDQLADQLGSDFPYMQLKKVLVCTACGRRGCVAHFSHKSGTIR